MSEIEEVEGGVRVEGEEGVREEGRDHRHQELGNDRHLERKEFFGLEADIVHGGNVSHQAPDWRTIMKLAFQCIGVVYGDLGTSPLYVLSGIFHDGIKHKDDLMGVMSLIVYAIIFIVLIKYVFVVLAADNNGDGGTFALYSLICRYAKVSFIPNHRAEDRQVSNHKLDTPNRRLKRALAVKSMLETIHFMKWLLLFVTMLAVSMLIGDGILTPCISVLSAVGGLKEATSKLNDNTIMWISVGILVLLFQIQRFGTDKVGYIFTPILLLWFAFIACIGLYNFLKYDRGVIKALNPWYIVLYFKRNGKEAWVSLGGVTLCLTGAEALFADLGHFNARSIQLSSCFVLIPSILLAYFGQCSYLRENMEDVADAFYKSIPKPFYWPQFVLAILASIIASQSLISASFSIVQQAVALGCFPRVKVVHTSTKYGGQVYVPEINYFLMVACVAVTLGFQNNVMIGNAYGIAVAFVFVITSSFLVLVMVMVWKTNIILLALYILTILLIEVTFLSSTLYKFVDGGYIPFCFAIVMIISMLTWNYGYRKKYMYELRNMVLLENLTAIASDPRIQQLQGIGLFYSHLDEGISPTFTHYVASVLALRSILIFVSVKHLPISRVPDVERFLFHRVDPNKMIFWCVARYGYQDASENQESFDEMLVNRLKECIQDEGGEERETDLALVDGALRDGGVVHLLGECELMVSNRSGFLKKLIVEHYNWLTRCVRQPDEVFLIPRKQLLKVGMTFEVE